MHQAAAQAQAQRRQEISQQQSQDHDRTPSQARYDENDPHVEASIARLLDRMRRSSVGSSRNDDRDGEGQASAHARIKKDEDDMDEDERLLASEEGKKLSSKERRQLRNKVSARAFRSRRKGDCASNPLVLYEANIAQNTLDTSRMILRSRRPRWKISTLRSRGCEGEQAIHRSHTRSACLDAFLGLFRGDDSHGGQMPSLLERHPESLQPQYQEEQQQQQQTLRPDPNASQMSNNAQVGLAMIPESPYEQHSAVNPSTPMPWNPNVGGGFDQQVYAMHALPEEAVVDVHSLSGKSAIDPLSFVGTTKDEALDIELMPIIECLPKHLLPSISTPVTTGSVVEDHTEFDDSDPSFALYADQPTITTTTLPKNVQKLELSTSDEHVKELDALTRAKFERLCVRMHSLGARVDAAVEHLSKGYGGAEA